MTLSLHAITKRKWSDGRYDPLQPFKKGNGDPLQKGNEDPLQPRERGVSN